MYTFDHALFLTLNFDGGPVMDRIMVLCSTPAAWAWLYVVMLWLVWRRGGWRALLLFDGGRGSRPCRHGGRHIQACGSAGVAVAVIPGTAAAHAHTLARGPCPYGARGGPLRYGLGTRRHDDGAMRDGFAGGAETVVFRADDCGYGRDMLLAHISCLSFPCRYRAGCSRGSRVGRGGTVCGAGRTAASLPCVAGGAECRPKV